VAHKREYVGEFGGKTHAKEAKNRINRLCGKSSAVTVKTRRGYKILVKPSCLRRHDVYKVI
jgi:hypothetical protein